MQMQGLAEMEQSGMVPLLLQDEYEDLSRMYNLFRRVSGGQELMCNIMGRHLKETGRALVQDAERTKDPVDFVQTLLAEKAKYDRSASQPPRAPAHVTTCHHPQDVQPACTPLSHVFKQFMLCAGSSVRRWRTTKPSRTC